MDVIDLRASYFAIPNPLRWLERWRHQYRHEKTVSLNGRMLRVRWTERADTALHGLETPLAVEVQLYFSCMVKKRMLFHQTPIPGSVSVAPNLELAFRCIASAACNPSEFAERYPEGRSLMSGPAAAIPPKRVDIDYRRGCWQGSFAYCSEH